MTVNPRHIFLLVVFMTTHQLLGQYFRGSVYKDVDKMPSSRMLDMAQLSNGEIWFATQSGLISYDGLKWESKGDSITYIPTMGQVDLVTMPGGKVYLFGFDQAQFRVVSYDQGVWKNLEYPPGFKQPILGNSYYTVTEQAGDLLFAMGSALWKLSGDEWSSVDMPWEVPDVAINSISPYQDKLVLGTTKGIFLKEEDSLRHLLEGVSVLETLVDPMDSNVVYLLSENLLSKLDMENLHLETIIERQIGLTGVWTQVNLMIKDRVIYFSYNSPIYQYDLIKDEIIPVLTDGFDIDHTSMNSIFDEEGNLWVATLRGAFKINNLNLYHYTGSQLMESEVSATFEDSNGDLFLGTNYGVNVLKPDGNIEKHYFDPEFLQPRVMDIVKYRSKIYLAASTAGVVTYENGRIHPSLSFGEGARLCDLHIYNDTLYSLDHNTLYRLENNQWNILKRFSSSTEYINLRKIAFEKDHQYILAANGVYDLRKEKWIQSDNAHFNNIYAYIQNNDSILLGTSAGICELKNDQIIPSDISDLEEPVYAFLQPKTQQGLWVGTGTGVYFFHHNQTARLWNKNGLIGNEVNRNAFQYTEKGKILIGTDEGVSFVNPNPNLLIDPVPRVEITGYQLNEQWQNSIPSELPNHWKDISIHYRGISYFDESNINYRVKLIGFKDDWQYIPYNNQRSVLYNNLRPGDYQFKVEARIGEGNWSETATSSKFRISKAIYQRWWFRGITILVFFLVMVLIIKYRNSQLKKRNDRLELMVQEKTQELNERNADLVKTIKELKSAQGQLIQSEKLASMGHLTAGIAHELNNPLNYIRGGAECIIRNINELNELIAGNKGDMPQENIHYLMNESYTLAESILTGAAKSTEIIKSLNSFSADSQNYFSFSDLEKEVETALTLLSNQFGFRISINRLFGNVPPVECYPAKINQLIVSLLLNAIQSIEDSGEITIRIFRRDSRNVSLEISDTGSGIPSEHFDKVFEPFFTTKESNSGLGLTIAEAIVQEHHGKIKIRSKPGEGTKVAVWLPVNQETGGWDPGLSQPPTDI